LTTKQSVLYEKNNFNLTEMHNVQTVKEET